MRDDNKRIADFHLVYNNKYQQVQHEIIIILKIVIPQQPQKTSEKTSTTWSLKVLYTMCNM